LNGQYQLKVGGSGTYTVETTMPAFAPVSKQAMVDASAPPVRLDFDLTLASRTAEAPSQE
jgi:hypothetical protein